MPIDFDCPHCQTPYRRLKDDLAGKRATCKNPDCRKVITIPPPAPGANGSAKPPADVEAAAAAALNEVAKEEAAPAQQTIPVTCKFCSHQWTEPFARAGKNVLCPDPECRRPNKVPELEKDQVAEDWRTGRTNKPSLAKENFEKPKDVISSEGASMVSGEALRKAEVFKEEVEPRPLSQKIMFGVLTVAFLAGSVFGVMYLFRSTVDYKENRLMKDALEEFAKAQAFAKDEKEFAESHGDKGPPAVGSLYAATLHLAAAEFALRHKTDQENKLKEAQNEMKNARAELQQAAQKDDPKRPTAPERYALGCEVAVATLALGGTDEEVSRGTRVGWMPAPPTGRSLRLNEKSVTVHDELGHALRLVQGADFDLKVSLARRLTRELVRRQQQDLAGSLPVMLFTSPAEQDEARAVIALEILRTDPGSPRPRQTAEELKGHLEKGAANRNPYPVSAQTLWLSVSPPVEAKTIAAAPPPAPQQVSDQARLAYVGRLLLEGKPAEAIALADRPGGTPAGQLRALLLYAEWVPDPSPALVSAVAIVQRKTQETLPQAVILRLCQLAAAAGKADQAKALADALTDEGLRAWARADAFRLGLSPDGKEPVPESAVEVPDDAKKLRAGHAWGRLWAARHNARVSNDRSKEMAAVKNWPTGTIHPFGLAGIALGLQDREK